MTATGFYYDPVKVSGVLECLANEYLDPAAIVKEAVKGAKPKMWPDENTCGFTLGT